MNLQDKQQQQPNFELNDARDPAPLRIQRRDAMLGVLQQAQRAAEARCQRMQQRIEDLLGPEAAGIDPPQPNAAGEQTWLDLCPDARPTLWVCPG